jgi:hypothetical protein
MYTCRNLPAYEGGIVTVTLNELSTPLAVVAAGAKEAVADC